MSGYTDPELNKVKVIARTKPTANFPHDTIVIEEDGKVSTH